MSRCVRCPCPVYAPGGVVCYNCVGMETTPSSRHIPCINCTMLICVEHAGHTSVDTRVCVSCTHILNMMLVDGVFPGRRHSTSRAPQGIYTPKYLQPRAPLTFKRVVHTRHWDDRECVICTEQFRVDGPDITKLGCGHPFHVRCVSEWAKVKKTCPTCRNFFGYTPHKSVTNKF